MEKMIQTVLILCGMLFTLTLSALQVAATDGEQTPSLAISGGIEMEARLESTDPAEGGGEHSSELVLASLEVGVEVVFNEQVSGSMLFEYEGGGEVTLDEAVIMIDGGDTVPIQVTAGEMNLPFGDFETHMLSGTLASDIGEVREAAVQVGGEYGGFSGVAFIFNGGVDRVNQRGNPMDNFGAEAGYALDANAFTLEAGLAYINNLLEADEWEEIMDEEETALRAYVGGLSAQGMLTLGPFTVMGEYLRALDDLEWVHEEGFTVEDPISAYNAEAGYAFSLGEREAVVAAGYQGTHNAYGRFPERRYLGTVGLELFEAVTLAAEYRYDVFENSARETLVTVQLALEF